MNSFLKKRGLSRLDLFYLAAMTLIGLGIRVILRVVITDDWLMYWDPWISDIKEMGFSYLATDRYDYTPTFIYILWIISKLPINPMTGYKGLHCILDFVAAAILGKTIYKVTGSRRNPYNLPSESFNERSILGLRVTDDYIIVRNKKHISNLAFCRK